MKNEKWKMKNEKMKKWKNEKETQTNMAPKSWWVNEIYASNGKCKLCKLHKILTLWQPVMRLSAISHCGRWFPPIRFEQESRNLVSRFFTLDITLLTNTGGIHFAPLETWSPQHCSTYFQGYFPLLILHPTNNINNNTRWIQPITLFTL